MTTDALKKLHTAMLDTREGYEVAEKDAETPALKTFFGQMIALRTKDYEAIHHALAQKGEKPDESGSFMPTGHKTMTSARSAVTGSTRRALALHQRRRVDHRGVRRGNQGSVSRQRDAGLSHRVDKRAFRENRRDEVDEGLRLASLVAHSLAG